MAQETILVPPEVVAEDKQLATQVVTSERHAKQAGSELARLRWEMCECPNGPRVRVTDYAEAVGRDHKAITQSVAAWTATIGDVNIPDRGTQCAYDGREHVGQPSKRVTDEQTDTVREETTKQRVGDVKALAVKSLAQAFKRKEGTQRSNFSAQNTECVERAGGEAVLGELTEDDATKRIRVAAYEMLSEHNEHQDRVRKVRRWMAAERAVKIAEVPVKAAAAKVETILARMQRTGVTWSEAERVERDWFHKAVETERITNELNRAAAAAVADLQQSIARLNEDAAAVRGYLTTVREKDYTMDSDHRQIMLDQIAQVLDVATEVQGGLTEWDMELSRLAEAVNPHE